jgi:TonB-dependent SusC/RagA subfamily outer membrane receptor
MARGKTPTRSLTGTLLLANLLVATYTVSAGEGAGMCISRRYWSVFIAIALLFGSFGLSSCASQRANGSGESVRQSANVLTGDEIEANYATVASLEELIQRHFPGMEGGITIRGGGPPLYVVNGRPIPEPSQALGINPRDVARIEIVRDGAQTAMYGFRGSNGAILITLR